MRTVPAIFRLDSYKLGHAEQYPANTELVYSNLTFRSTKHMPIPAPYKDNKIVWVGLAPMLSKFQTLWEDFFNAAFFDEDWQDIQNFFAPYCGPNGFNVSRLRELHELGYLPLEIRALPEGSVVREGVPVMTVHNTHPKFYWLTNAVETWLSADLWKASTAATIARAYRKVLEDFAEQTGGSKEFITWQAHDFSVRGMSGIEDAAFTGIGHLAFFQGSDNVPAARTVEENYFITAGSLVAGSVPATEHSVMCAGGKESEIETFRRLIKLYPSGVFSVVSDTWDFWNVLTVIAPALKEEILARVPDQFGLAKTVFRPDSGDPVKIVCGDPESEDWRARKGAIELLWDEFGGTVNEKGFKQLNPRVGLIYGDSITLERAVAILRGLRDKGFASDNIVFGVGSFTYQYVTRDSGGMAMKATYVTINGESFDIFKDPVTDSGTKRSAKGLLRVVKDESGEFSLIDQVTWDEAEFESALITVFEDGTITDFAPDWSLVRQRAMS